MPSLLSSSFPLPRSSSTNAVSSSIEKKRKEEWMALLGALCMQSNLLPFIPLLLPSPKSLSLRCVVPNLVTTTYVVPLLEKAVLGRTREQFFCLFDPVNHVGLGSNMTLCVLLRTVAPLMQVKTDETKVFFFSFLPLLAPPSYFFSLSGSTEVLLGAWLCT